MPVLSVASLSSAAVIANLVPALAERAVTPATAAAFGAMFGLMQLPGRALMTRGRFSASPLLLLTGSLALQALGLMTWAMLPSMLCAFIGIGLFAMGSGLMTLVRPYLVHAMFERRETGYLNGRLAQAQQLARAAGPVLAACAVTVVSYSAVLAVLGAAFAGLAVSSSWQHVLRRRPLRHPVRASTRPLRRLPDRARRQIADLVPARWIGMSSMRM